MLKIHFKKQYFIKSILVSILFSTCSFLFGFLVFKYFDIILGKQNDLDYSKIQIFFMLVVIAPIIETLLFQYLIINQVFVSYGGKNKKTVAILISSLFFGIIHYYSFFYFLSMSILGLILAYSFCYFKQNANTSSAIFYVILIHSSSNCYAFLIKTFELL